MLRNEDINFLIDLTKDVIEIIRREIQVVDFWENYTKQKRLRFYIISHLLKVVSFRSQKRRGKNLVEQPQDRYYFEEMNKKLYEKRNEFSQKLIELAYHIYGK